MMESQRGPSEGPARKRRPRERHVSYGRGYGPGARRPRKSANFKSNIFLTELQLFPHSFLGRWERVSTGIGARAPAISLFIYGTLGEFFDWYWRPSSSRPNCCRYSCRFSQYQCSPCQPSPKGVVLLGLWNVTVFLNSLTPKFYVALTGTSSLISGLIFIFEWWYFHKHGTSFIEQVSVSHLRPLMGGTESSISEPGSPSNNRESETSRQNLSVMQKAWRERNPPARIKAAYQALELNNDCATAYVLLAEEEATTIVDAERLFKQALKAGETIYRRSQQCQHQSPQHEAQLRRDTNVLVYIKRRLAMCARKLGRIREAVKIMRDLMKEFPPLTMLNIHENLLESLLELQAYADVQAVLAKYDDISLPKSAAICYTAALLKTRTVSDKFSPETASRRGLSTAEINAVEAIHRAVEFNPHVPKYLLEMKSLILPPEHILKRGDSEAVAYAFFHLQHWKRIEGALNLLQCTWEGTFRMIPYPLEKGHLFYPYPSCTETADRELLPPFHHVSVYPKKEIPFFIHFTAGLCSSTAMIAFLTHQFPEIMGVFAKADNVCPKGAGILPPPA
ncbi:suppressor of tumorigenicity 7 protein-like isoform 12-T12 [Dama dama]|uniref:suppressor of tumorigenicity 7 protein-like isoform X11 n=1 Tax=Dama dama TaxID=30532 RepID=UPI002A35E859|nr:suppressor of tumorigenicity 7 protein-like isoform X11 [Dama dama]